jgi:hypothetical protein
LYKEKEDFEYKYNNQVEINEELRYKLSLAKDRVKNLVKNLPKKLKELLKRKQVKILNQTKLGIPTQTKLNQTIQIQQRLNSKHENSTYKTKIKTPRNTVESFTVSGPELSTITLTSLILDTVTALPIFREELIFRVLLNSEAVLFFQVQVGIQIHHQVLLL